MSNPRAATSAKAQRKIAEQRAAEQRRRKIIFGTTAIGVVVALFAVLIIIKVAGGGAKHATAAPTLNNTQLTAQVVKEATGVPVSVLTTVGAGGVAVPTKPITGAPALTSNGKPDILYMGAEYCPYCAAERWALVVTLSRFGTFSGLALTQSDPSDVYPSTNTFTFLKATYTSQYISFDTVELEDGNRNPLQSPTTAQQQLLNTYDAPPYVSSDSAGAIPFVDLGNQFMISGASYSPQVLAGQTWSTIASALNNPSSPVAQGIEGTANQLTAAICKLTGDKPASVCSTPLVSGLESKLG